MQALKRNTTQFSAVKGYYYTQELKGTSKEVHSEIIARYERQTDVEDNLTVNTARGVKRWLEFKKSEDIYPNLEYMPTRSANPRQSHRAYYGIVRPMNDPIWSNLYPPNGFECKCWVRQTDAQPTIEDIEPINLPSGVSGNAAIDKVIFSPNHNMVKNLTKSGKEHIKLNLEALKADIPYSDLPDYKAKNGSNVSVHVFADEFDVEENFKAAVKLTDELEGLEIKITPHVIIKDRKNPEYLINNKIADLKHQSGKNISSNLSSAIKQGCEIVVIQIMEACPHSTNRIIQQINGNLKTRENNTIKEVILIEKNGDVRKYKT